MHTNTGRCFSPQDQTETREQQSNCRHISAKQILFRIKKISSYLYVKLLLLFAMELLAMTGFFAVGCFAVGQFAVKTHAYKTLKRLL